MTVQKLLNFLGTIVPNWAQAGLVPINLAVSLGWGLHGAWVWFVNM
jgi:hypothetical protein